jgi:hypothetical protein
VIFLFVINLFFFKRTAKPINIFLFLLIVLPLLYLFHSVWSFLEAFDSPSREVCRFQDSQGDLIIISSRKGAWLDDVENSYRTSYRHKQILPGLFLKLIPLPKVGTKHGTPPEYRCPWERS